MKTSLTNLLGTVDINMGNCVMGQPSSSNLSTIDQVAASFIRTVNEQLEKEGKEAIPNPWAPEDEAADAAQPESSIAN